VVETGEFCTTEDKCKPIQCRNVVDQPFLLNVIIGEYYDLAQLARVPLIIRIASLKS